MSWLSENYHKAALGGGVLALGAIGYLSWSNASELQAQFETDAGGKKGDGVSVPGGELIDDVSRKLSTVDPLKDPVTGSGRVVDLFASVDLFVKDGKVEQVVDILEEPPVHPPIPNEWWVKHRIDPSFSDSPQQDADRDGFANIEEFEEGTNPADDKSYPALVNKLEVKKIDSTYWLVELNSILGNDDFQFRYRDSNKKEIRMRALDNVKIGDVFFNEEPANGRFKVIEKAAEMIEVNGRQRELVYAVIEDLAPNKKGTRYKAPYRTPRGREPMYFQFDNVVTFELNAAGQQGKTHTVKENESFKVTVDGKTYEYRLASVDMGERPNTDPVAVIVEYDDNGEKKTREIPVK
ncbi:MAG: Amuc_1099 family pilus-like system protein [Verrucomicrobiaceae bacterium]